MKNIVLIAPPAAGKGTISNILSDKYNIPHISTGELLRQRSNVDDEFGIDLLCLLKTGELVDDDIVFSLIKQRLSKTDCRNGFILDGYPRTLNQATELNNILSELGLVIDYVFYLDIDKETSIKRISGRMSCSNCGAIYNKYAADKLPSVPGICDNCGSKLTVRTDDNIASLEERFDSFYKFTYPVVEFYKNTGKLVSFDGTIDSNILSDMISDILKGDL